MGDATSLRSHVGKVSRLPLWATEKRGGTFDGSGMGSRVLNLPPLPDLRGKAEIAGVLSAIEQHPQSATPLLDEAFESPKGVTIGITGPPGAGKSTLINALIAEWRKAGLSVAVIAVDPSSTATGGALLGDRVRMRTDPNDDGVFIRSVAARGRLGGLADIVYPASVLLRALYDRVIIESVGVGQSETDISIVSDTVVLCIQPASGDSLQFMKAGIAEIPDVAIVTKADIGAAASRALADLKGALSLAHREIDAWEPECFSVSVTNRVGSLGQLFAAFTRHQAWLGEKNRLTLNRNKHARSWVRSEIITQFGRRGLELVEQGFFSSADTKPFATARRILTEFSIVHSGSVQP
jgi:LAO/AO transport system kinase